MTVPTRDIGGRAVGTALAAFVGFVALLGPVTLLSWAIARSVSRRVPLRSLRFQGARLSGRAPDRLVPTPLRVLPPPPREYLGVWGIPPTEARDRLLDRHGFDPQVRAYLQAYEHDGTTAYEAASCAYRPDGFLGGWQLHVRLFPRADDRTDVWCHWERNPTVAPFAHLRKDGYDPDRGKRRFREIVADASIESGAEGPSRKVDASDGTMDASDGTVEGTTEAVEGTTEAVEGTDDGTSTSSAD